MHSLAEVGDVVSASILSGNGDLPEIIQRCFGAYKPNEQLSEIQGTVLSSWTVHHPKRRSDPLFVNEIASDLSARDASIIRLLSYMPYVSPSDSVSAASQTWQ